MKWDLRFLFPDLRRPGTVLRLKSTHVHDDGEPIAVVERVESELAAAALRYRLMLWVAVGTLLAPGLLAWTAWDLLWRKTPNGFYVIPPRLYEPFIRGYYVPNVSLYEIACYVTLFLLVGSALYLSYLTVIAMYRLSPDYRLLDAADQEYRGRIAAGVASGRWPRVAALLTRGREFAGYAPLIDREHAQQLATSADPGSARERIASLGPVAWSTRAAVTSGVVAVAAITLASAGGSLIRSSELAPWAETVAIGAVLIGTYGGMLAYLWWLARREDAPFWSSFGLRGTGIGSGLMLGIGMAFAARLGANLWGMILRASGSRLPDAGADPTTLLPPGPVGVIVTVAAAVILAPLAEEMLFRGVVLDALRRRFGDRSGVYVSSLAFAAVHVNPYAFVPVFVLSIVLSRLYIRTGSLWASVFTHAAFNGIGLVFLYWVRSMGAA